jgi:alpha-glucosidase
MCGLAIVGQDIGGFECNYKDGIREKWVDPMLLIRWTIAGAFLPWFRNHYNRNPDDGSKPNVGKLFQEPFMFQEHPKVAEWITKPEDKELYNRVVEICRHYISLRYRLLQLFYDLMFENM